MDMKDLLSKLTQLNEANFAPSYRGGPTGNFRGPGTERGTLVPGKKDRYGQGDEDSEHFGHDDGHEHGEDDEIASPEPEVRRGRGRPPGKNSIKATTASYGNGQGIQDYLGKPGKNKTTTGKRTTSDTNKDNFKELKYLIKNNSYVGVEDAIKQMSDDKIKPAEMIKIAKGLLKYAEENSDEVLTGKRMQTALTDLKDFVGISEQKKTVGESLKDWIATIDEQRMLAEATPTTTSNATAPNVSQKVIVKPGQPTGEKPPATMTTQTGQTVAVGSADQVKKLADLVNAEEVQLTKPGTTEPLAEIETNPNTGDATKVLKDIFAQEKDPFDSVYDLLSSDTPAGKIVKSMYEKIKGGQLHKYDNVEKILGTVIDQLEDKYGQQDHKDEHGSDEWDSMSEAKPSRAQKQSMSESKTVIQGLAKWKAAAAKQGYSVEGPSKLGIYQAYSKSGGHKGTFKPGGSPPPGSLRGNSKPGMSADSGTLFVEQGMAEADMFKHNNGNTGFKELAQQAGGGEQGAKIAGAQLAKMRDKGQVEEADQPPRDGLESPFTMEESKMPMKKVNGKSVPAFAADGKGKNDLKNKKVEKVEKVIGSASKTGKNKMPSKSDIEKMCNDGKTVAQICKMHSNCDQAALKKMVADCKKKMVAEGMNQRYRAAYHKGRSNGLLGEAHCGKNYDDMEEARHYHMGFMEGIDECYGGNQMPIQGMVDEGQPPIYQVKDDYGRVVGTHSYGRGFIPNKGSGLQPHPTKIPDFHKIDTSYDLSIPTRHAAQDLRARERDNLRTKVQDRLGEADMEEGNLFTGNLATARRLHKSHFDLDGDGDMEKVKEFKMAFESLDRQLLALLNEDSVSEGMTVSISKGQENSPDSVSINASDAEADSLLAFVKQAGLGIFGGDHGAAQDAVVTSEPSTATSDAIEVVDDHDGMLSLIRKMAGQGAAHDHSAHDHSSEDYADEENCNECGMAYESCGCDESDEMVDEGLGKWARNAAVAGTLALGLGGAHAGQAPETPQGPQAQQSMSAPVKVERQTQATKQLQQYINVVNDMYKDSGAKTIRLPMDGQMGPATSKALNDVYSLLTKVQSQGDKYGGNSSEALANATKQIADLDKLGSAADSSLGYRAWYNANKNKMGLKEVDNEAQKIYNVAEDTGEEETEQEVQDTAQANQAAAEFDQAQAGLTKESDDDNSSGIVPALVGGGLGYALGSGALNGIGSAIGSAIGLEEEDEDEEEEEGGYDAEGNQQFGGPYDAGDHYVGGYRGYDDRRKDRELNEWANSPQQSIHDEQFEADIEFMTNIISGGLNKQKIRVGSGGQTTVPVVATVTNESTDLLSQWKKLSGI